MNVSFPTQGDVGQCFRIGINQEVTTMGEPIRLCPEAETIIAQITARAILRKLKREQAEQKKATNE